MARTIQRIARRSVQLLDIAVVVLIFSALT
jgi:hypothetical protein